MYNDNNNTNIVQNRFQKQNQTFKEEADYKISDYLLDESKAKNIISSFGSNNFKNILDKKHKAGVIYSFMGFFIAFVFIFIIVCLIYYPTTHNNNPALWICLIIISCTCLSLIIYAIYYSKFYEKNCSLNISMFLANWRMKKSLLIQKSFS